MRKAVAGSMFWLLQPATAQLASMLTAHFEAWWRVQRVAASESVSHISPITKGSGIPESCGDLRGIAMGTLPAKVYATILEQRLSA